MTKKIIMSNTIANKTMRTSFWGAIEKVTNMGTHFIVTLLLARLLCPEDYGIIAMLTVFIAISQQIIECGFSNALIRKQDCSTVDYSTAFFFNISISIAIYLVLFLCAPLLASFYDMPLITDVLRVYGITLILDSFRLVQYSMLVKGLEFKNIAKISSISVAVSGVVGIVAAYLGLGVWALVIQTISNSLLYLILVFLSIRWIPILVFSKESFKYLWGFGSKMLLTGIISSIYSNIYSLVIGKVYSSKELGIFNRGQNTASIIPGVVQSVFNRNSLPILSELQNDNEKLISVYRKFISIVSFITFPCVLLLCVLAKPFVYAILTEKWAEAIVYIQIFSITAILAPANFINLNLLQVKGRTDLTLKAEIIKKSIGLIMVFALMSFGPLVLAIGSSLFNIFTYSINLYYAKKLTSLKYSSQLKDMSPYFFASIVSAICVYITIIFVENYFVQLILGGLEGMLIYFFITKYIFKIDLYNKFKSTVLRK